MPNEPNKPENGAKASLRTVMDGVQRGPDGRHLKPQERDARAEERTKMEARSPLRAAVDDRNKRR